MKKTLWMLLALLSASPAYADDLLIEDAWVRLSPPVADSTAAYMVVRNTGSESVKLTGVACDVADSAGMHAMRMDGNRMVMSPLSEVGIPANGEARFSPGGSHVMLMGLKHPLKEGEMVEIVFRLSDGENLTLSAPVRDMRAGHAQHSGMH
ncbi:MAG: hypothetical protein COZ01_01385 [Zetaproteobacteria bacterium CG_4_10_14_0_8_um_filter_55_43]|nr:MAG: hypothetical protein AUJ58_08420 [Zetaproteobacteria bacterium CG1_02_55_237]PIY54110.1 MAG: hypothetical protein COZ01_01385 [Zetaproteobacteria bacterium CG_4_10_14_0_8_um_filter_55_43]